MIFLSIILIIIRLVHSIDINNDYIIFNGLCQYNYNIDMHIELNTCYLIETKLVTNHYPCLPGESIITNTNYSIKLLLYPNTDNPIYSIMFINNTLTYQYDDDKCVLNPTIVPMTYYDDCLLCFNSYNISYNVNRNIMNNINNITNINITTTTSNNYNYNMNSYDVIDIVLYSLIIPCFCLLLICLCICLSSFICIGLFYNKKIDFFIHDPDKFIMLGNGTYYDRGYDNEHFPYM